MNWTRGSGIFLHPTALPGRYGIGDLGRHAYSFVDFLWESGQSYWHVLPLGPTGYGDSPYQSFSSFAGNPMLIDLDDLALRGFLSLSDLQEAPAFPEDHIEHGWVYYYKYPLLQKAFENFKNTGSNEERSAFRAFCEAHWFWLEDYALFMALRNVNELKGWNRWEKDIAFRRVDAIVYFTDKLAYEVEEQKFWQYLFFSQWKRLKRYCHDRGIRILGVLPFYPSLDSADVWANPQLFQIDGEGNPTVVAGVPPDAVHAGGLRWGNPVYRWDLIARTGYQWWIERIRTQFEMVDCIRLDYFQGYGAYWEIPAEADTPQSGRWAPGPGASLFQTALSELPKIDWFAEDLGCLSPEAEALKRQFDIPGMAVFQYAFSSTFRSNPSLPHFHTRQRVAYTGTHNDLPFRGWFESQTTSAQEKKAVARYLRLSQEEIHWEAIRAVMASVAALAIFPLQDVVGMGCEGRLNTPGKLSGNWQWRYSEAWLTEPLRKQFKALAELYGR